MSPWYWCILHLCALLYTGYCKEIHKQNSDIQDNEDPIFKNYQGSAELFKFYESLAQKFPKIMTIKSIGKTYENRDIKLIIISNGNPKNKKVFIDGGIHAREWISPATVSYLIYHIAHNFEKESPEMQNTDWYIVPIINVDGYEYSRTKNRLWRKNVKPTANPKCMGTDLNRNFGFKWGVSGISHNPCSDVYLGTAPFSEPESLALSNFILNSNVTFSIYLTYHSYVQSILYPWGYGYNKTDNDKDHMTLGNEMAKAIYEVNKRKYKVMQAADLSPASGASDDWAKSIGIEYSYTMELPDRKHLFELPPEYIIPVGKENLAALRPVLKRIHKK